MVILRTLRPLLSAEREAVCFTAFPNKEEERAVVEALIVDRRRRSRRRRRWC
jgi:hypothetical protein